jgi:hypothetical protein
MMTLNTMSGTIRQLGQVGERESRWLEPHFSSVSGWPK